MGPPNVPGVATVNISVDLDTDSIQKRPRAVWIALLKDGMQDGTWAEIYEVIALAYVAGGDHSEYVISQSNTVEES